VSVVLLCVKLDTKLYSLNLWEMLPLSGTAVFSVYLFTVSNGSLLLMLEVSADGATVPVITD